MARPKNSNLCSVANCWKPYYGKGLCREHWTRNHNYGRTHKIVGLIKGNCIVEGCGKKIKGHGFCRNHHYLKVTYGIDPREYENKLKSQNYKCFICEEEETKKKGKKVNLAVDHCHKTNKIRELLCWRCNTVIGRVNENIELLRKMITYLELHIT